MKPKRKKETRKAKVESYAYSGDQTIKQALSLIAGQRTGGAINIKGLGVQLVYACSKILQELSAQNTGKKFI